MPRAEPVEFPAGEVTLAGTLTLPDADPPQPRGRYPNVLLLPSYYPRDRDGDYDRRRHPGWFAPAPADRSPALLARLAEALARHGVASLRYDKRGCGDSGGTWADADWFGLIDDARDAVAYLRSRRELDLARTGILGHGEGGVIAMTLAIGDPAIGPLTLIAAPARGFRDVFRRQASRLRSAGAPPRRHPFLAALARWSEELVERADRREPYFVLPLPTPARRARLRLAGWHQAFHTPAIALATMLHRSVALVHGDRDALVDSDESRILLRVLSEAGNEPSLRLLPGVGHELEEADDALVDELATDLAARLVPRALPPVLVAIEGMA